MFKLNFILVLILVFGCSSEKSVSNPTSLLEPIEDNLKASLVEFNNAKKTNNVSPRTFEHGQLIMVPSRDWTSGFYPGILWMMYELTHDVFWKNQATIFTLPLEDQKFNGKTHDMGFKMYCSFGKAYENTKKPSYRDILIQSAKTLSTRFNPVVGCIRSWDHNSDKWDFPVIIDNMMNLELLFWAGKETGNEMFKQVAISHAKTTLENHFRDDHSSYHVVDYNPETGAVEERTTHQGYAAESAWSRGQAWGLYGYTMVFRETGDSLFLNQAEKIAKYILEHKTMPQNLIPYWDFDAPSIPNEPLDVSAAAITASALYELSQYTNKKDYYLAKANKIMETLITSEFFNYRNEDFLLKHSTGSKPHNSEIDVPLIYADYYFIEALSRKINYKKGIN